MKAFFILLVAAVPALGQSRQFPSYKLFVGDSTVQVWLIPRTDSIRVMSPDRMPCVVPNLAYMERMPIRRQRNGDKMPNGAKGW
jgi:hypothetical protein